MHVFKISLRPPPPLGCRNRFVVNKHLLCYERSLVVTAVHPKFEVELCLFFFQIRYLELCLFFHSAYVWDGFRPCYKIFFIVLLLVARNLTKHDSTMIAWEGSRTRGMPGWVEILKPPQNQDLPSFHPLLLIDFQMCGERWEWIFWPRPSQPHIHPNSHSHPPTHLIIYTKKFLYFGENDGNFSWFWTFPLLLIWECVKKTLRY